MQNDPLVRLGRLLRESGYRFTTITPASHARVNARPANAEARTVRDVFGWSRSFSADVLPTEMLELLCDADAVTEENGALKSRVRFSTDGDLLFVHSAFPTTEGDAVFFGPDTYRYLQLLRRMKPRAKRAVDVGCGSGAGGILIAPHCGSVVLADINQQALRFAEINAAINGVENIEIVDSDVLRDVQGDYDLIISNPPYLIDDAERLYRDGGGRFGEGLSVEIVRQSVGTRLILYTATAIVDGVDTFRAAVEPLAAGRRFRYEELDPDVFGEELERNVYASVERIAVIALELGP
ncbi:MAG TPA: class I SAM-dependent methyltransferase [Thermoanaerobaculia bacterium]|nr:class I SAM-dependent methyltransferase [Thermoanaerobaculia bacterium]